MLILSDYHCETCGTFERLEERPAPMLVECPCGAQAGRVIGSKVGATWKAQAVSYGGREAPPHPNCIDTRPLADGMKPKEWKHRRKRLRISARHDQIKANI